MNFIYKTFNILYFLNSRAYKDGYRKWHRKQNLAKHTSWTCPARQREI
jgi:hypothetical protein